MDEKTKELINFNNRLRLLVSSKIKDKISCDEKRDNIKYFFDFAISKAYKHHYSIILLCKKGYGEDAFIILRSFLELFINSLYILQDKTNERLYRYLNYDWVSRVKLYNNFKKINLFKVEPEELKEIEENYKRVMSKYSYKNNNWSNKNLREMAKSIDREELYNLLYAPQSNIAHSGPRSIIEFIKEVENNQLVFNNKENENMVNQSLAGAYDLFSSLIKEADKIYQWNIKKSLEELDKEYIEYAKYFKK